MAFGQTDIPFLQTPTSLELKQATSVGNVCARQTKSGHTERCSFGCSLWIDSALLCDVLELLLAQVLVVLTHQADILGFHPSFMFSGDRKIGQKLKTLLDVF